MESKHTLHEYARCRVRRSLQVGRPSQEAPSAPTAKSVDRLEPALGLT